MILLVLTVGTMVAGELAPKSLALEYPTQIALYTYWPMRWSLWLLGPFIWFLNGSGTLILRLLGSAHGAHRHVHSPEEIELLIAESHDGGLLEPDELRRLQRALRFSLRTAAAVDDHARPDAGHRRGHAGRSGAGCSRSTPRKPTCLSTAARSTPWSAS